MKIAKIRTLMPLLSATSILFTQPFTHTRKSPATPTMFKATNRLHNNQWCMRNPLHDWN